MKKSKVNFLSFAENFIRFTVFFYIFYFFLEKFFFENLWAAGPSLQDQMQQIDKFSHDYLKKIGLTGATILGSVWAAIKGNLKLTGGIVAIGLILSLYLGWIEGGMKLG